MTIASLRSIALSVVAVAEGATTPNPGAPCWAWSSTLSKPIFWDGSRWTSLTKLTVSVTAPSSPSTNDLWIGI